MSHHRIERVSELVKQQIGEVLQGMNLTDCGFVTVTSAVINPDLKDGRIYVSVIGNDDQKMRTLHALERHHSRIQHELSRRIILKYTPRLKFILDETEAHAQHIESLLNELDRPESHD